MQIELTSWPITEDVPRDTVAPWLDEDSEKARLLTDWWCDVNGRPYCVRAGYVTDWASIPWWIEWLYPHDAQPFRRPALLHDYMYSHLWPVVSKRYADRVFLAMLKHEGVPLWRRWAFYAAVSVGGKGGWHRVKDKNAHPFWRERASAIGIDVE